MIVYYTGVDQGDGSLGVEFFDCKEAIELLEEYYPETYRGEGGGAFSCDGFSKALTTIQEAKRIISESTDWVE